jgi:hypothetical protein
MSDFPPPPPPPPNYAYNIPGYAPVGGFRAVGRVGKALYLLELAAAVGGVLSAVMLVALSKWGDRLIGDQITTSEFRDKVAPLLLISVVVGGVGVAVLVLQCIWSFRLAKNLPLLGRHDQTWAPAWGIAGWILSGCTLGIIPYLMHCELWKGSDPERPAGDPGWKAEPVEPLLHVWLALTILGAALGIAGGIGRRPFGLGGRDRDLAKSLKDGLALNVASSLIGVVAAIVFAIVVQRLTRRHMDATGET